MRKFFASLAVICLAGIAVGQSGVEERGYDDGSPESMWHVATPANPSDWFNTEFNNDVIGDVIALVLNMGENGGLADTWNGGLYQESTLFLNAPDLANPITTVTWPIAAGTPLQGPAQVARLAAPVTLGTADDVHMAVQVPPGDSHTWLGADTSSPPAARSYFTNNGYASGSIPYGLNWMLRIGLAPAAPRTGTLLVNGGIGSMANPVPIQQDIFAGGPPMCLTFWGCPGVATQFLLYLNFGALIKIQLPFVFTNTGSPYFPGPSNAWAPNDSWMVCTAVGCDLPSTFTLPFMTIFEDWCNTKPSGAPKLATSNIAYGHILTDWNCVPQPPGCWGKKDDGIVDWNIWKVGNPAWASDWFNVAMDEATSQVNMITSMEVSNFDFCGIGPTWGEVGVYPDLTGTHDDNTPDIANPFVSVTNASMNPGASDGTAPYTLYDFTDFAASTTTKYHAAVNWPTTDTCIWIGSDTDGTDSTCARRIPTDGSDSAWTWNAYATPGIGWRAANWCMRINWTP